MKTFRARFLNFVLTCSLVALSVGCATGSSTRLSVISGESIILAGETPAQLAFTPKQGQAVVVRSTYDARPDTVVYEEGKDYRVDYATRTIARVSGSRIPDFTTNVLYGQKNFDHSKFPGFSNNPFFVYVDYVATKSVTWPVQANQATLLPKSAAKLKNGEALRIVAYGDSITAGGEATRPQLIFWQRWADALAAKYPAAKVTAINGATGGDATVQGLQRLQEKVIDAKPDLVVIGFGMNDHNKNGVKIPDFEANLKSIIAQIREKTGAEVVLFSAFPPNPDWMHSSHSMDQYAAATEKVAREVNCAFVDVFHNWNVFADLKKPGDMLANNINHPNDFGHWIYFRVLSAMGL